MMTTTADLVKATLADRGLEPTSDDGNGQLKYPGSPFRPGSNSNGFSVKYGDDGEHGTYFDHVTDETGSLYDLAERLSIPRNGHKPASIKRCQSLADYAQAHGVTADVFKAAGWGEKITYQKRPAFPFKTKNGTRFRFLDGNEPKYKSEYGYKSCWYGLDRAVKIAQETGQPLVICNGEASTVVGQHYGLAATAITGGEKPKLPANLLAELKAAYDGRIAVIFDCDDKGRKNAPKLASELKSNGYQAQAKDLALDHQQDLADFCKLHQENSVSELGRLAVTKPKTTKSPKSKDYLAELNNLGYFFRMNACNDRLEINGKPINDGVKDTIRTKMRDLGYRRHLTAIEEAYSAYAYAHQYHPVRDYLSSLKWDEKPRIADLAAYFTDADKIFGRWLKSWLVGSVAKVFESAQNLM